MSHLMWRLKNKWKSICLSCIYVGAYLLPIALGISPCIHAGKNDGKIRDVDLKDNWYWEFVWQQTQWQNCSTHSCHVANVKWGRRRSLKEDKCVWKSHALRRCAEAEEMSVCSSEKTHRTKMILHEHKTSLHTHTHTLKTLVHINTSLD